MIGRKPILHSSRCIMDRYNRFWSVLSAITEGRIDFVREAIKSGLSDKEKLQCLRESINSNRIDMVEEFLQSGFHESFDVEVAKLLNVAIVKGGWRMAKSFLEYGVAVDYNGRVIGYQEEHIPFYLSSYKLAQLIYDEKGICCDGFDRTTNVTTFGGIRKALYVAVEQGDTEMVTFLLEKGANVNFEDERKISSLIISAEKGYTDIVMILLQSGANANYSTPSEWISRELTASNVTAIFCAATNGHAEIVKLLIEHGARVDSKSMFTCGYCRNGRKITPLLMAVKKGYPKVVEHLLKSGADPNFVVEEDETALSIAAREGHVEIAELLLQFDAKVNFKFNNIAKNPLIIFIRKGLFETVKVFLKAGANFHFTDKLGRSALHFAVESGNQNLVSLLLELGEEIDARDKYDMTSLLFAAEKGFLEIVKFLLVKGADILAEDVYGRTALFIAAEEGYDEVVKFLIGKGAQVDPKAKTNLASFFIFSERDSPKKSEIISRLLQRYIYVMGDASKIELYLKMLQYSRDLRRNINKESSKIISASENCWTPLLTAILARHEKIVEILLESGADPRFLYYSGASFSPVALITRKSKIVQILSRYGVKVTIRELESGKSPPTIFPREGPAETVEALFKFGDDTNISDFTRETTHDVRTESVHDDINTVPFLYRPLLTFALKNRFDDIVNSLVQSGADLKYYEAPLSTAISYSHPKMVETLLKFGADVNSVDDFGCTPLHSAIQSRDVRRFHYGHKIKAHQEMFDIVKILLEYGAQADTKDRDGMTPLHKVLLCWKTQQREHFQYDGIRNPTSPPSVMILLKVSTSIESEDNFGRTPLHYACHLNSPKWLETLLNYVSLDSSVVSEGTIRKLIDYVKAMPVCIEPGYPAYRGRDEWGDECDEDQMDSYFRSLERIFRKLYLRSLIIYAIKMKAANPCLWRDESFDIELREMCTSGESDINYWGLKEECEKQIAEMKNLKFSDVNISLYDVLFKNVNQLSEFVKCPQIVNFFSQDVFELGQICPNYNDLLKNQFEKAVARNELLERGIQFCSRVPSFFSTFPLEVIEYILSYLSSNELRTFIYVVNRSSLEKFKYLGSSG